MPRGLLPTVYHTAAKRVTRKEHADGIPSFTKPARNPSARVDPSFALAAERQVTLTGL